MKRHMSEQRPSIFLYLAVGFSVLMLVAVIAAAVPFHDGFRGLRLHRTLICAMGYSHCNFNHNAVGHLKAITDHMVFLAQTPDINGQDRLLSELVQPVGLTPVQSCCVQPGRRCQNSSQVWEHPTWQALGFAPQRTWCRYAVERTEDGMGWVARAACDLDCDGDLAIFEITVGVDLDGLPTASPYRSVHDLRSDTM